MDAHAPPSLLSSVYRLLGDERRRQATDRDLLQAFVQRGENDAFTELLRRHGPMVLHLALHLLHHRQDAEDVFQATFLTLARKARSLRCECSAAASLHPVAWRLALRSRAAKRRTAGVSRLVNLHQPADAGRSPDPADEISLRESQELLHQELAALPEHLRLPLLLCYLQGRTRDEAARQLGWSLSTLKRRMEQGRKLLHGRLSRRGVTLPAVLSATLFASAQVPASLVESTLRLATSTIAGTATLPVSVAALMAEAARPAKAKALAALVLMLGACAGTWVYCEQSGKPAAPPHKARTPSNPSAAVKGNNTPHPGRDQFGDPLPAGAVARLGTVRMRHGDYISQPIRFVPDGKTLISVGFDGVRVWDAATGKPVRHFATGGLMYSADLSGDGRRIVLNYHRGGSGGPVEVWDVTTGKLLHKSGNRHYRRVRFSPDGKQLAALSAYGPAFDDGIPWKIDLWDATTGRAIRTLTGPKEYIADMIFSADGKSLLLGGSGKAISVRSITDGKEVRRFRDLPGDIHSLCLSPRGDRLACIELWLKKWQNQTSWGSGTRVFLLDARTGDELRRWSVEPKTYFTGQLLNGWCNVAFSPEGRRLAACQGDGPVHIWDTDSGTEQLLAPEGRSHSGGVAFSPDGKTLAAGEGGHAIRLIDAQTGADRLPVGGHRSGITTVALSRDGRTTFTAAEKEPIHRWDAATGRECGRLPALKARVDGLLLSPDGRTLYSQSDDKTLRAWDVDSGKERRILEKADLTWSRRITLSPDGKMLAVPIGLTEMLLLDPATGQSLQRLTTKTRIIAVAFTSDVSAIKALTADRTIWRWEIATGRRLPDELLPPDRNDPPLYNPDAGYGAGKMVFAFDGRVAAHGFGNVFLRIVDVSRGREIHRTDNLPNRVASISFAADGRTLVWAEKSGTIHWLELATWSERRSYPGHAGAVAQMVFTPDGKRLISASEDTTVLVWDLIGQGSTKLSAEQRDACWSDLADKDAAKAYRSMCGLIAAPADALALLRSHLKTIEGVEEKRIARLIADLDSDAFVVREKATEELRKLGDLAEPKLRKTMASRPRLEMRRRVQGLLDEIVQHHWRPTPEILRQLRAIEVLERIDTPEARKLLEFLAGGAAGARQTREACAAVQRLRPR